MKSSSKRAARAPSGSTARPAPGTVFTVADVGVLERLLLAVKPVAPGAARQARMKDRILAKTTAAPRRKPAIITIPASDQGWTEALPKVHIKQVYTDGTAESYLVRLEPGARAPAHNHPGDEECVVLEGSVRYIGGSTLNAGDYEAVLAGARHTDLVSDTGALVYLRYSQPLSGYLQL